MTRKEWIGNYQLHYSEFHSYKNEWVEKTAFLGKCLGVAEACEKAVNFIIRENLTVDYSTMYVSDGWGNKFYATKEGRN